MSLESIFHVLREYRGYLTLFDEAGEEVIVGYKKDVLQGRPAEKQLAFATPDPKSSLPSADEMLEKINRDIALFRDMQVEEEFDDLAVEAAAEPEQAGTEEKTAIPPPRRVRFEPIRGDLPPELQE